MGNLMESEGQKYLLVKCEVCDKCWCLIGQYRCIYGGPYHGYEERDDDSGYSRQA